MPWELQVFKFPVTIAIGVVLIEPERPLVPHAKAVSQKSALKESKESKGPFQVA